MCSKFTTLLLVLMGAAMWKLSWKMLLWYATKPTKTQPNGHLLCAEAPSTFVKTM